MNDAVTVVRANLEELEVYASISIAFQVRSRFAVALVDGGLGGLLVREEPVHPAYIKDYDKDGDGPRAWPALWPVANWGFLLAYSGDVPSGGAAIAIESPGLRMADAYPDSACLWDIRVQAGFRSKGIGSLLLAEAERWARERGYRKMHVETQNVNVPACRFYASHGFRLFATDARAYPKLPAEAMLLWGKDL